MHDFRILFLFLLAGLLISCAPSKNGEAISGSYELQLIDSVRINYSKGGSPETKASYDASIPEERMKLMDQYPMEFAVFDSEFENRAVDLPVPKSIVYYSAVVGSEVNIVALKDQEHAGVEEDFHTLYKFKLVSG
jgi:hypothetical protein